MVANYIFELACLEKYGTEIIYISKASILKIEKIKIELKHDELDQFQIYLPPTASIDLSFIKSLDICDIGGFISSNYSFLFYIQVTEFCSEFKRNQ